MRARELDNPDVGLSRVVVRHGLLPAVPAALDVPDNLDPDQKPDAIELTLEFTDGTARRTILWNRSKRQPG